jgi:hypothetical protein
LVGYLDSSVVLRALLSGDTGLDQTALLPRVSSELLEIECRRSILRDRGIGLLDDEKYMEALGSLQTILEETELIELDPSIKRRAMEAFPVHVKTLDALHLATALAVAAHYRDEIVAVFSYDQTMNRAAKALGLAAPWYT